MMAGTPLVFVVDDDPSVRKSLKRLLASAGYGVEAFASAREFLARERHPGPCCLVLDVRMPGLNGLELQEALAAAGRRMSIVFVTGHADVPMSVKAMKGGAVDLLTKPVDGNDLLAAIERCLAKDVQDLGDAARVAEIQERVRTLTPREAQVFALVVTGMLNKQIASALGISEKTVKGHLTNIFQALGVSDRTQAALWAERHGLLPPA